MKQCEFVDLSREIGISGDKGLMVRRSLCSLIQDVRTSPNYAPSRQVFILYTMDSNPEDGVEPPDNQPVNQRTC
jgi:hypothetical protein